MAYRAWRLGWRRWRDRVWRMECSRQTVGNRVWRENGAFYIDYKVWRRNMRMNHGE